MRRLLLLAAVAAIVVPAFATPGLKPETGVRYGTYDLDSGTFTPTPGPLRYGDSVWAATTRSGYYFDYMTIHEVLGLDWGDIAAPQDIGGFTFGYGTDELLPTRIRCVLLFFAEDNGRNSSDRVYLAGFNVTDLPTGDGVTFNSWTVTVDLEGSGNEFTIDGSDIDFDGLADFAYTYYIPPFDSGTFPASTGPTLAGDPNDPTQGDGMEDIYDRFTDPNMVPGSYTGTWWWSGVIFAQFYMELYDGNLIPDEGCPNPGDSGKFCTADIDSGDYPGDCLVNLADLAQLLSNYGTASGASWGDGDVDPPQPGGGDGDVDLGDLAELLSQYGDDCRE